MPTETVYFPGEMYSELKQMVENEEAENFSQAVQQEVRE